MPAEWQCTRLVYSSVARQWSCVNSHVCNLVVPTPSLLHCDAVLLALMLGLECAEAHSLQPLLPCPLAQVVPLLQSWISDQSCSADCISLSYSASPQVRKGMPLLWPAQAWKVYRTGFFCWGSARLLRRCWDKPQKLRHSMPSTCGLGEQTVLPAMLHKSMDLLVPKAQGY